MKQCTKCKETKPLTEFYLDKRRGHHRSSCKKCCYRNDEITRMQKRESEKRQITKITDRYVKHRLIRRGLPITGGLIELQRTILLTKRLCKNN